MFSLVFEPLPRNVFLNYLKIMDYAEEKVFKKHIVKRLACCLDIETTSTRDENDEKSAFMYAWVFGINGVTTVGRYWFELISLLEEVKDILKISLENRLIVYVHNLSFEFQFIRKRLEWFNVFSLDKHEPLYALTVDGFEFRCSYKLSNYNLAKLADNLLKYKVKKQVGDLDYDLIRHSKTTLTQTEWNYIVCDCLVVMAYIQECIENDGGITKIPLTSTGYVREYCRRNCLRGFNKNYSKTKQNLIRKNYLQLMKEMSLTVNEYKQLKRVFGGGFTHANPYRVGKLIKNAESMDFTSSYPFVMCSEKFPMGRAEERESITEKELNSLKFSKCVLFDCEFINIEASFPFDNIISLSKCPRPDREGVVVNNGRVVRAKRLCTTLTEVDYESICKFYTWDKITIRNVKIYPKSYLPINLIKSILKLYEDKTVLKDVVGMEIEYLKSKGMINSVFGMCVTDIVRDTIIYDNDDGWDSEEGDVEKLIEKYNNSNKRFLSYQWGIWTTAYARRNLFTGIYEFNEDYIYSDTDSLKGLNFSKHTSYVERYNKICEQKLRKVSEVYDIDFSKFAPKTKKGKTKMLGVWDYEGSFSQFKTLGAKRYMWSRPATEEIKQYRSDFVLDDEEYNLTVSGVNKNSAVPYLLKKDGKNIIENFDMEFSVPEEHTGKLTHTYIEYEQKGKITDYLGIEGEYHEYSSVHLEKASYTISENAEFTQFLYSIGNI